MIPGDQIHANNKICDLELQKFNCEMKVQTNYIRLAIFQILSKFVRFKVEGLLWHRNTINDLFVLFF